MMMATLLAAATEVAAQNAQLYVDAGVSHARPPAEVGTDPATYAMLGGRFVFGPTFGSLYGAQALDSNSADWLGGTLGAFWATGGIGGPGFSLTGIFTAFTLGEPTPYDAVTGRLIPEASLPLGASTLIVRGYGGLGRSDVADRSVEPPVSVVSDLWAYGAGLELIAPFRVAGAAQAWAGAEIYDAADGPYYAAYVGGGGALGRTQWNLRVKLWDTPAGDELEFRFALAFGLARGWTVEAAAGRAGPDPLLGSPAGIDGGVTLVWSPLVRAPAPPLVSLVPDGDSTAVIIRLKAAGAESVSVMGDFSAWEAIAMERQDDSWTIRLTLAPGVYHFGFRLDGEWFVPDDATGLITDEYGQRNATLVVPGQ